ncbi:MAG: hypothetical protein QHJ81_01230 [Anaerolineae bacterium]|nr:hypothetical protein [Anaerolineae bacterium]
MAEAQVATLQTTTLSLDELREIIRSVVREEITAALEAWSGYFEPTIIEPGPPLHEDLEDIEWRAREGRLKFYTYEEVFGE